MPPQSLEFHQDLRRLEDQFGKALLSCIAGYSLGDPIAAFEYARTYATKFYDKFLNFYSQFPGYRQHWQTASEAFALQRTLHCIDNISILPDFFGRESRIAKITKTISDHAQSTATALIEIEKAFVPYSASKNPLLAMMEAKAEAAHRARAQVWAPVPPQATESQANEASPTEVAPLAERRARMLETYKAKIGASNRKIYEARNSGIHKPQFYEWLNGTLPTGSATTKNFERFLREQKAPIPRKPNS